MKAKLVDSKVIARDIKRYYFEPEHKISQTAGQFIEMHLKHDHPDDRGIRRWFTLSSSPTDKYLAITTKQIGDKASSFKKTLDKLKVGDHLDISDPMGDFVLPKDSLLPLIFVAGGIGITPFLSIAEYLRSTGEKRQIHLFYAVSDMAEALNLAKYSSVLGSQRLILGQLSAQLIYDEAQKLNNPLIYISGPEHMVEGLNKGLEDLGVDKTRLIGDFFPGYD
ncbi:MAG TPA: FAD-dependent oxidoreductase [Candidatus Saccharimonadales bacterium]|jgi:ferredoxin-NADP reductase